MEKAIYYGREALQLIIPVLKKTAVVLTRAVWFLKGEYDELTGKIRRKRRMQTIKKIIGLGASVVGVLAAAVAVIAVVAGTQKKKRIFF